MGIEIQIVGQCSHLLIRDKKVQIETDIGLADTKHGNWSPFHLDVLSKKAISLAKKTVMRTPTATQIPLHITLVAASITI